MLNLPLFNEWWDTGTISREKAKEYHRQAFSRIQETFSGYRQILLLTGLRRIGKTTLLYQLINTLLQQGTNPKTILYFSFDEKVEEPLTLLEEYSTITKVDWRKERCFIFLDEIQKLKEWSRKIKVLYDAFPQLRFSLSGSASLPLEHRTVKDLAGRYFSEVLSPLTLQEFAELYFQKKIDNFQLYEVELQRIKEEYIRKPFPEIVHWTDQIKINQYIRELVVEKIVRSDIPETFENINFTLLSSLTEIFLKDVGMILDSTSLSRDLGVHKLTLMKHLYYLEFSNVITIIKNFRPAIRAPSRKLRKVYPAHIALSLCSFPQLTPGKITESLVCSAWQLHHYWREGGKEIDFLKLNGNLIPIEVKEKETIDKNDYKTLLYFLRKYELARGIIVYSGKERVIMVNDKEIMLLPIHKLLFTETVR